MLINYLCMTFSKDGYGTISILRQYFWPFSDPLYVSMKSIEPWTSEKIAIFQTPQTYYRDGLNIKKVPKCNKVNAEVSTFGLL